jgi:hypothetical protein
MSEATISFDDPPIIYKVRLYNIADEFIGELIDYENISWGEARNDFVDCAFDYQANGIDPMLLANLVKGSIIRIWIQRAWESELHQRYAAEIVNVDKQSTNKGTPFHGQPDPNDPDTLKSRENLMTIFCEAKQKVYLKKRGGRRLNFTIGAPGKDEAQIFKDSIDHINTYTYGGAYTLNQADTGIRASTALQNGSQDTGNIFEVDYDRAVPLKSFQEVANRKDNSGNDQRLRGFRISPSILDDSYLTANYEAEYGTDKTDLVIYTNPLLLGIREISTTRGYSNRVEANGKGGITESADSTITSDLDRFKLRVDDISRLNILNNTELQEEADQELQARENALKEVIIVPTIVGYDPLTGRYRPGDLIRFQYDDGFIVTNDTFRVFRIDIVFNKKSNTETVRLVISKERITTQNLTADDVIVNSLNSDDDRLGELER